METQKRIRRVYDHEVLEYLKHFDLVDELLSGNYRVILRPSKFEDRKQVDYEIYQQQRDDNLDVRTQRGYTTTVEDTTIFYLGWLRERVENINAQLSDTHPNGKAKPRTISRKIDEVEMTKYRKYLLNEIKAIETELETHVTSEKGTNDNLSPSPLKVEQRALALFYYYCHAVRCLPPFVAGKMEQSYKDATSPHGLAWKPFQKFYGLSKSKIFRLESIDALNDAIVMLKDYPKALQLAKDELNSI